MIEVSPRRARNEVAADYPQIKDREQFGSTDGSTQRAARWVARRGREDAANSWHWRDLSPCPAGRTETLRGGSLANDLEMTVPAVRLAA